MTVISSNTLNDFVNTQLNKTVSCLSFANGVKFYGPVEDNLPSGFGTFTWLNEEYFQGFFKNGMRNKIGFQKWSEGDIYIGEFYNDKRHGWGIYKWANNDKYEGSFYEDLRHGYGTYTSNCNNFYIGTFYMNEREGYGTFYYENGNIFQGLYKNNHLCGPGILQYTDGRQDIGLWNRNSIIKLVTRESEVFTIKQFSDLMEQYPNKFSESYSLSVVGESQNIESQYPYDIILKYKIIKPYYIDVLKNFPENDPKFKEMMMEILEKEIINPVDKVEDLNTLKEENSEQMHQIEMSSDEQYNDLWTIETVGNLEASDPHQDESRKKYIETDSSFQEFFSKLQIPYDSRPLMDKFISHIQRFACNIPIEKSSTDIREMTVVIRDILSNISSSSGDRSQIDRTLKYQSPGDFEMYSKLLISLSHRGNVEEIKNVLQSLVKINVNVTDCNGSFSLVEATLTWDTELINYLLDCGANVNHVTDEGISPLGSCMLFYYPQNGFFKTIAEDVVKLNQTPFNYPGIRRESFKTFNSLEKTRENTLFKSVTTQESVNGIYPSNVNGDEWNHYQMAEAEPDIDNIGFSKRHPGVENGETPLDKMKDKGSYKFDSCRNCIEYPIKVDERLVEKAATILSVNSMIIDRQPRPNSCFQEISKEEGVVRFKALKISRNNQMLKVIKLLLQRGANPNICQVPFASIFFSVKSGDIEMTKLLISKGANPNATLRLENLSLTPLHISCCLPGNLGIEITELLLQSGADPNLRAVEDDSFLDTTLIDEWSKDTLTEEQRCLSGGKTPLHLVCSRYDDFKVSHSISKLLLSYGANPNLLCNGHTPLTLAIASGNDLIIDEILNIEKLLINQSLTHGLGNALCVASSTSFEHTRPIESRLSLIKKLISFGADPLAPVSVGIKRSQGIAIDFAYYIFNLDQRVAHLPYHALTSVERDLFNTRKAILSHIGMFTRENAVEKEKQRLQLLKEEGIEERMPSPDFIFTGSRITTSAMVTAVDSSSVISKVSKNLTNIESQMHGAELLARRPLLKYCYECGRSVNVKLTACTRCKEVYFCSKLCKTKAWTARHKSECLRVGGRVTSAGSDHKSNRNIDSPTPATVAEETSMMQRNQKLKSKLLDKKDTPQFREKLGAEFSNVNDATKNVNIPRRLPPLSPPSHPSYSYMYIIDQYVKVDNMGRLLSLKEGVLDNYSFE